MYKPAAVATTAGAAGGHVPYCAPATKPQLTTCSGFLSSLFVFCAPPADNLLAKKANKHLLQDYDHRQAAAVGFMSLVRPCLSIAAGALTDPQVGLRVMCLVWRVMLWEVWVSSGVVLCDTPGASWC